MAITEQQLQDINEARTITGTTIRPTVNELEDILLKPIKVLDHGFIRVIDYMGDDNAIVQAARVSYGKGTKKVNQDKGLIAYLLRHYHSTPFEMCEIKLHIKLPIFIARQWIRHRTANVNEYSARYSILGKEFYTPAPEQLAAQSKANHQGRDKALTGEESARVLELLKQDSEQTYKHYEEMLNEDEQGNIIDESKDGLARELARMNLTLNYYTEWYWKIDLHNFMHFLRLRADDHAQYEIQVYAKAMLDVLKRWVPFTYEAFMDYRVGGYNLSQKALEAVQKMVKGSDLDLSDSGMSKREIIELQAALGM